MGGHQEAHYREVLKERKGFFMLLSQGMLSFIRGAW